MISFVFLAEIFHPPLHGGDEDDEDEESLVLQHYFPPSLNAYVTKTQCPHQSSTPFDSPPWPASLAVAKR